MISKNEIEIILMSPLNKEIIKGTKLRIHGLGGSYIYTASKLLQPGDEETLNSTIQKDESILQYSPKALPRGVYYVVPLILSYSINADLENQIMIKDFILDF